MKNIEKKIFNNTIASLIEKSILMGGQLLASIILIRLIDRSDFGMISTVAGYFVFVSFINVAIENHLVKGHRDYELPMTDVIANFIWYGVFKSLIYVVIAATYSLIFIRLYNEPQFFYPILAATMLLIADAFTGPLNVLASVRFRQDLIAKGALFRVILNLAGLLGLLLSPSLAYLAFKDTVLSLGWIAYWFLLAKPHLEIPGLREAFRKPPRWDFIRSSLQGYSIWIHLTGAMLGIIYRSDTFFLSLFASLTVVGNYGVALSAANVANILPSVLGFQNSVAISHADQDTEATRVTNTFIRISFYISVLTVCGFLILGIPFLKLITGQSDVSSIYFYMICIVSSLALVKTFAAPLHAYLNIRESASRTFTHVLLPTVIFTLIIYTFSAYIDQARGLAFANIALAIFWLSALWMEMKRHHYDFSSILQFRGDYQHFKRLISSIKT